MPEVKEGAARLWLVRHAQSAAQTGEELSIDSGLSALGRQQAARLAEPLGRLHFDAIFLSPLKRTRQTFELSGATASHIEFNTLLLEDMLEGGYAPILPYGTLPDYGLPDTHNAWPRTTLERVDAFLDEIAKISISKPDVLVVSHAMFLNVMLHRLFGAGIAHGHLNSHPSNASISLFIRSEGSERFDALSLWNFQEHLDGLPGSRRLLA